MGSDPRCYICDAKSVAFAAPSGVCVCERCYRGFIFSGTSVDCFRPLTLEAFGAAAVKPARPGDER